MTQVAHQRKEPKPSSQHQPLKGKKHGNNSAIGTNTAVPGTLFFLSEEAKGDNALDGTAAAVHINKWTDILDNGAHALERALGKERSRLQRLPIVFAFMETDANQVQLAHSFEEITLNAETMTRTAALAFSLVIASPRALTTWPSSTILHFVWLQTLGNLRHSTMGNQLLQQLAREQHDISSQETTKQKGLMSTKSSRSPCCGGVSFWRRHAHRRKRIVG
jgi:hypothetical protein